MSRKISVYIHIPFCKNICPYCDFCKVFYREKLCNDYLEALEKEIKKYYQQEVCKTIYLGGGTPSCLSPVALEKLFKIVSFFQKNSHTEYTIECNIEDINEDKIKLFQKYGVNRISIGIQTSIPRLQQLLEREISKEEIKRRIDLCKHANIQNINVDLMYALPSETKEELEKDIDFFLSLNVPHISTYSFMLEPHTKFSLQKIELASEEVDASMYEYICTILKKNGYFHYEVSNFAKEGFQSSHNLSYWNHDEYYGFGVGAAFYYKGKRGSHTRNLTAYIQGNAMGHVSVLTQEEKMDYFLLLGLRKREGISKKRFQKEFSYDIKKVYSFDSWIQKGVLQEEGDFIYLNESYFYVMNTILVDLLYSRKIPEKGLQTFV